MTVMLRLSYKIVINFSIIEQIGVPSIMKYHGVLKGHHHLVYHIFAISDIMVCCRTIQAITWTNVDFLICEVS